METNAERERLIANYSAPHDNPNNPLTASEQVDFDTIAYTYRDWANKVRSVTIIGYGRP